MPELPEVETFARILRTGSEEQPGIIGLSVESSVVLWSKTLAQPAADDFARLVIGQSVDAINRRGKFLIIQLDRHALLIHLRMSGDLQMVPPGNDVPRHTRLLLKFTNGWILAFNDPRKFGRVWCVLDPLTILSDLGREPLDSQLTPEIFHQMLHQRKRQLKPLLLDQKFLSGVGNIYSDEALHLAGLHPLRNAISISSDESRNLLTALQNVLTEGIARNGSSIDWVYRGGDFQNNFRVYGRTGKPCPVCGTPITHLMVGQRSTHICSACQKMEES